MQWSGVTPVMWHSSRDLKQVREPPWTFSGKKARACLGPECSAPGVTLRTVMTHTRPPVLNFRRKQRGRALLTGLQARTWTRSEENSPLSPWPCSKVDFIIPIYSLKNQDSERLGNSSTVPAQWVKYSTQFCEFCDSKAPSSPLSFHCN